MVNGGVGDENGRLTTDETDTMKILENGRCPAARLISFVRRIRQRWFIDETLIHNDVP